MRRHSSDHSGGRTLLAQRALLFVPVHLFAMLVIAYFASWMISEDSSAREKMALAPQGSHSENSPLGRDLNEIRQMDHAFSNDAGLMKVEVRNGVVVKTFDANRRTAEDMAVVLLGNHGDALVTFLLFILDIVLVSLTLRLMYGAVSTVLARKAIREGISLQTVKSKYSKFPAWHYIVLFWVVLWAVLSWPVVTTTPWVNALLSLPLSRAHASILGDILQAPTSLILLQVFFVAFPTLFYVFSRNDVEYFPRGPAYKGKLGWRDRRPERHLTRLDLTS